MSTTHRIERVRRRYNQWVANQTLEDFALRFTAKQARKWSSLRVGNTALGAISFLALEAIGGAVTLNYGFTNAAIAIAVVGLLLFLTSLPISYYAAKFGVDIDLLSRGAGFGYIGSTITSLIYASFTFIFFAIEASIMSMALEMVFGLPLSIGYLVSSVVVIPLVTHGITLISRFQLWTQPLWIVLHLLPFIFIGLTNFDSFRDWTNFTGSVGSRGETFNILLFGAAGSVIFSLIAQIGEQVDFLRFMPEKRDGNRFLWWVSLLSAGPGWAIAGALKLFAGSFLAFLAVENLLPPEQASEPSHMYLMAFRHVFSSPEIALAVTGIFVILSQIKINVTNSYAGSIAWSNFFSRLTHSHPGRVVWLVFNVAIALLLMEMDIYKALEQILGLYSIVAVAWVGALVADLVVNKPLGLSPPHIEFKRAHLYDINPVGVGAMVLATAVALISFTGGLGDTAKALASFSALGTAFVASPLIALATSGRYYIARQPAPVGHDHHSDRCCICEHTFEVEDIATCPVYDGKICSLCCSLDARCGDMCKSHARFSDQILRGLKGVLPDWAYARANSQIGHYLGMHLLIGLILAAVLSLLYFQSTLESDVAKNIAAPILWKTFIILMIVSGVASWLFILAHQSRRVAQEETKRQTQRLEKEIAAHRRTDAELQKAREVADAANIAKSRYVAGLAHEVRTPLNAIFGYSQLLEKDQSVPKNQSNAVSVIHRSAEHMARLIEGIADISKIEAGRLHLLRDQVNFTDFLDQLEDMFELQAENAGLTFTMERSAHLPQAVYVDEKRLRQILINLLTNAIKFTPKGGVVVRIRYRSQVAEFEVEDTGIGIAAEDHERIFKPFERGNTPQLLATKGTGLGLAITKLLTEIMGGEIKLNSTPGRGSRFSVRMFLSEVTDPVVAPKAERPIVGYEGARQTLMIVDDDPSHRGLLEDILAPLGFDIYTAESAERALRIANQIRPDMFLLDVSMPNMNGWQLARALRKAGYEKTPILMVSANNRDERLVSLGRADENYLMKPISVPALHERLKNMLDIQWIYAAGNDTETAFTAGGVSKAVALAARPSMRHVADLLQLGGIGHIKGIQAKLDEIESHQPESRHFVSHMRALVQGFEINQLIAILEELQNADDTQTVA